MDAVHLAPGPALAPFVRFLGHYAVDGPSVRERVLPSGGMQLLVNLYEDETRTYEPGGAIRRTGGAVLQGARDRPVVIDTDQQRAVALVAFRPGGAHPFFRPPAGALTGGLVELADLWGRDGAVLRERLLAEPTPLGRLRALEAALAAHAVRDLDPDPAIRYAAAALGRGAPVAEVTDRLGLTPKGLIRRFDSHLGLGPKRFSRLRRFQRALASVPYDRPADWAEIAHSCGYYDQAHLIRDFREFAGITPTEYRARSPHAYNHIAP